MLERKNNMCNKKKKCAEGNEKYPNAGCCDVLEEKAAPNKAQRRSVIPPPKMHVVCNSVTLQKRR